MRKFLVPMFAVVEADNEKDAAKHVKHVVSMENVGVLTFYVDEVIPTIELAPETNDPPSEVDDKEVRSILQYWHPNNQPQQPDRLGDTPMLLKPFDPCNHRWVSIKNEVISGCMCTTCGAIRG